MFKKFFKFLKGYVIIEVYGKSAERFVNICLRRGIEVWGTLPCENGIKMCMFAHDFMRVRQAARKCRVKITIKEKRGLLRTALMYRGRYMFAAGLLACLAFMTVSSQFIWLVEVNGVENSDINSIYETLDSLGVKSGALKRSLPESMEVKSAIVNGTDKIAWAWMYIEGAKVRIEIYEQTLPPTVIDKDMPCDIVAACDGVVKHIIVKNGESAVRDGDAVSAGDKLVSGKVAVFKEGYPEEYIYVHSMAQVQAYTTHTQSGEYKLFYESRTPTGRHKTLFSLELFGKMFSLPMGEVDYESYDVKETRRELYIPFFGYTGIALDTVCYSEEEVHSEPLSIDTALEFAKNDLEKKISERLTLGSVLTDENIEYKKTDDETINVTLEMNFIQNIATEQKLEDKGEEVFDKQTN